jgi:hypothetical protein
MKTIEQDIFEGTYDYLIHCCNLYHTWGGGFVVPLRKKYPEAFEADLATEYGSANKFGGYSFAVVNEGKTIVVNLYAQWGVGNNGDPLKRNAKYDALYDSIYRLCQDLVKNDTKDKVTIAVPYLICCGLAGGKEEIVLAILQSIENTFPKVEFNLYKLPERS